MPPHFFGYLRWSWLADDRRLKSLTGFAAKHDIATVLTILATERKMMPTPIDEVRP